MFIKTPISRYCALIIASTCISGASLAVEIKTPTYIGVGPKPECPDLFSDEPIMVPPGYNLINEADNDGIDIVGTNGRDLIVAQYLSSQTVSAKAGADLICIYQAENSLIKGGDGKDHIEVNYSVATEIRGGNGKDHIHVPFEQRAGSSIRGGDGADHIAVNRSHFSEVRGGNGPDMIEIGTGYGGGFFGNDGSDEIYVESDDLYEESPAILKGGNGKDRLTIDTVHYGAILMGGRGNDVLEIGDTPTPDVETALIVEEEVVPPLIQHGGKGTDRCLVIDYEATAVEMKSCEIVENIPPVPLP